jgi:TRAP transporter 4TM/12TM fusion protein
MAEVRNVGERNRFWRFVLILLPGLGMFFALNQIFRLNLFGLQPLDTSYLYLIIACYVSIVFILFPAKSSISLGRVPWYDSALFLLTILVGVYFALHGLAIIELGWEYRAPTLPTIFSIILWGVVIEAVRRSSGFTLAFICLIFSFYPLYAGHMPGFLQGQSFDFLTTARNHAMSVNSILGVPLTTVGTLLIGFMFFGVVLQNTGGGEFFLNIANALLGHVRGGPAKVAVVASAFFGTLSGSAVSNVITTGCMTIPAMKKTGYEPHYAGAVEACASTGGTIMPPVMGAAAFVMASFISIPYAEICLAALIPSLLYYLGLFFQVDLHAAKIKLRGIPKSELPSVGATLKSGWYYIFVIVILCYFLFTLRVEAWAPFYASALLIVIAFLDRKRAFGLKMIVEIIMGTGRVLGELVAILAGVGLLVGALSVTGVAFAFSRELVMAVGNNLFVILLAGALTSFVLGFGMTSTACYIFLSIVMAPALVAVGVKPIAAHFFVLYWGIISFITPPVALAAYAAASIAQANPMKTGFTAMRLGIITYFIPFLFVYNPLLLAQGSWGEVLFTLLTATAGVFFICMGIEGWGILGIGPMNAFMRLPFIVGGPLLVFPGIKTDIIGAALCAGTLFGLYVFKREKLKERDRGSGGKEPSSSHDGDD